MKKIILITLFSLLHVGLLHSQNVLWKKTITNMGESSNWFVGEDGAVAILELNNLHQSEENYDTIEKLHWYGRDGSEIAEILPTHQSGRHVLFVSHDLLMVATDGWTLGDFTEIFQFDSEGRLIHTVVDGFDKVYSRSKAVVYPYILGREVLDSREDTSEGARSGYKLYDYEFTLYDVTSASFTVVGDAAIGVHRSNLRVRWKTLADAKYKVQTSTDLQNWTDFTEIIDGTGSRITVNIPMDPDVERLYARVIKL